MFFDAPLAYRMLDADAARVRPGGVLTVNVLVEGTTFLGMFGDAPYHLFDPARLRAWLHGWTIHADMASAFAAAGATEKHFLTLIAGRSATR